MASYETRRGVYIAAIVLITLFCVLTFGLVCRIIYLRHFATTSNNKNLYNEEEEELNNDLEKQNHNNNNKKKSILRWFMPRRYGQDYVPINNNNSDTSTLNTVPSIYLTTDDDSSKVLVAHISESGAACWRTPTSTSTTIINRKSMDELDLDMLGGLSERDYSSVNVKS